jgi:GT2 family glycosyltransferase
MTRRCSQSHPSAEGPTFRDDNGPSVCTPFALVGGLPGRAGWHRLVISGVGEGEEIELRLDFGLGFVGHHAISAVAVGDEARLFIRLFKPLKAVRLLSRADSEARTMPPKVRFERLSAAELWSRRALEQLHLLRTAARVPIARASRHDRPRRLWGWTGLQAFPDFLTATAESSYSQWRRVADQRRPARIEVSCSDWLLVMDCRAAAPSETALSALLAAADEGGAKVAILTCPNGRATEACMEPPLGVQAISAEDDAGAVRQLARAVGADGWLLFLEPDVMLEKGALHAFAAAARGDHRRVVYSDNDHMLSGGRRFHPQMRTCFSIERLWSEDWLGAVIAVRAEVLTTATILDSQESSLAHRLCRHVAAHDGRTSSAHVPQVLYSRLAQPRPSLRHGPARVAANRAEPPRVSIIIPTRNRADLLERCVGSIVDRTRSATYEIIIHDNASDDARTLALLERYARREQVRVVRDEQPFNFSRINNEAAAIASGEVLLFLNNDTEVVSPNWLERLASIAIDPAVGCAGPLLLMRNGRIQHAGLVTGPGGIAGHLHSGLDPAEVDPAVPLITRDVSALTGACLAVERRKFLEAGGFDAEALAVSFNDVELCLRLEQQGLRNVFVADVTLVHLGSASRDDDDFTTGTDRFRAEFRVMRERWGRRLDFDPYFPKHMRPTKTGPQLRLA